VVNEANSAIGLSVIEGAAAGPVLQGAQAVGRLHGLMLDLIVRHTHRGAGIMSKKQKSCCGR
jgi:hypothetical protein